MENRGEGRTRRQEIQKRLDANEELLGKPKASPEPGEEERERKIEEEHERTRFIRSFAPMC